MNDDARPVSGRVLDQAIAWQLRLGSGEAIEVERAGLQEWLGAGPEHVRAWRQLGEIDQAMAPVRSATVRAALARPRRAWRGAAGLASAVLIAVAGLVAMDRHAPLGGFFADYRTATGEQRRVVLEDGSVVHLATRTVLDVCFDGRRRTLLLRQGEIQVETAHRDPAGSRPLVVLTRDGSLRSLGTRFLVRRDSDATLLTVTQSAVAARAADCPPEPAFCAPSAIVKAGQSVVMRHDALEPLQPARAQADAWIDGLLSVNDAPLSEVVAELARYRSGLLDVDPRVARLRITGTLPLGDTGRALSVLTASHPLHLRDVAPGWQRLEPAK